MNERARFRVEPRIAMKAFVLLLLLATAAIADDQIRDAQTTLKSQGFYYGDINGTGTPETVAAIRRFQIRNGLESNGQLDAATLEALGMGTAKPEMQKPPPPAATPVPEQLQKKPPLNLRRDNTAEESDRDFLRREEARRQQPDVPQQRPPTDDPAIVRPPTAIPEATGGFPALFANTPYENAPLEVQTVTLRRAQEILSRLGHFRDPIDAQPGPATEEGILTYQRKLGLPLSGRLDLQTLSRMQLLPGRTPIRPATPRVYRGVIVE